MDRENQHTERAKHVEAELQKKFAEEKLKNAQHHEEINQLKRDKAVLELQVKKVSNENTLIQSLYNAILEQQTRLATMSQASPSSVVPGLMAYATSHKYTVNMHPYAPRESRRYINFTAKRTYAAGTGKVSTRAYGSNEHWDLGLCHVQLNTRRVCRDKDCEWRHRHLSSGERFYISLLQPNGPKFLVWYDEASASKILA